MWPGPDLRRAVLAYRETAFLIASLASDHIITSKPDASEGQWELRPMTQSRSSCDSSSGGRLRDRSGPRSERKSNSQSIETRYVHASPRVCWGVLTSFERAKRHGLRTRPMVAEEKTRSKAGYRVFKTSCANRAIAREALDTSRRHVVFNPFSSVCPTMGEYEVADDCSRA